MKKNTPFYLSLIAAPLLVIVLLGNKSGATNAGVTGSPGDGGFNCSACHVGAERNNVYNMQVNITTDIPSGGYVLGQTYNVTVALTEDTNSDLNGFQITAENLAASKVGTFSTTDAINMTIQKSGQYVTQTTAGASQTSWSFQWTAPTSSMGAITFYVAALAGPADDAAINDEMKLATYNISGVLAVNQANLLQFSMFPNPSDGQVTLQLPSGTNQAKVTVFDYLGKTLMQKQITDSNNSLDVSNLSTGIYFVRIQSDTKTGTKKLVIR